LGRYTETHNQQKTVPDGRRKLKATKHHTQANGEKLQLISVLLANLSAGTS
jgi:hypothetical protein